MSTRIPLLDERALARTLARMATEIVERAGGTDGLVLVGIQRRGVELADRLKRLIEQSEGSAPPASASSTSRSIATTSRPSGPRPVVGETSLPRPRRQASSSSSTTCSTPAAPCAPRSTSCADFGRPRRILLCVLVDRGGRELPIQADIVGTTVERRRRRDRVDVLVAELDGRDAVELVRGDVTDDAPRSARTWSASSR